MSDAMGLFCLDRRSLMLFAVTLLLPAATMRAQVQAEGSQYTLKVSTQLVLLDASVTDKRTNALVGNLTVDDFVLTEDKVPQKLTYLSTDRLPLSIALLFDLTDTVQPVLKPLSEGASQVLAHLRPEDEVAVLTFSNHVALLQAFTQDRELVKSAITLASQQHDRNMATFIHEAVYTGTEQAMQATLPNSRRVEIWLTDGTSNYNTGITKKMASKRGIPDTIHSKQEATELVNRSGSVASVLLERSVLTDMSLPLMPLMGHYGEINDYANLTGGPIVHTASKDVADKLAGLIDALRQRYTLGYKPSTLAPNGTVCHVELALSPAFWKAHPGLGPKDFLVRTRKVYVRANGSQRKAAAMPPD